MKILIYSKAGDALSLARIMSKNEGNEVKYYEEEKSRTGEGIVQKVDNFENEVEWADLIVFDDENQGELVESLQAKGKVVFGTNKFGGMLENDRDYFVEVLDTLGIDYTPSLKFDSLDKGKEYIKANPGRYVFKPYGQKNRFFTKVGRLPDGKDLLWFIDYVQTIWEGSQNFILQKYVEGIEVGLSAMFSVDHFVTPFELNFEHKKQREYGQGGNCGEAGTLQCFLNKSSMFNDLIKPFETYLKNTKYVGQFDINCKVNEDGIFPLEPTDRLGIPATYGYDAVLKTSWSEFLYNTASGKLKDGYAETGKYIVIVLVDVEPVPSLKGEKTLEIPKDVPVFFDFDVEADGSGFFEGDLRKENGQYYMTGDSLHIGYVIGSGKTVQEAQDAAYNIAEKIHSPQEIIYLNGIGDKFDYVSDFLKRKKII